MLDQLVESRTGGSGDKRGGFLLTTLLVVFAAFFGIILYSLFDKFANGMETGNLELSKLDVPVPVAEEKPEPEPEKEPEKPQKEAAPEADVREKIIQDMDESPQEIDKISNEKQTIPPRRKDVLTVQGDNNSDSANAPPAEYRGPVSKNNDGIGTQGAPPAKDGGDEKEPPPVMTPKPTPTPKPEPTAAPVPKIVSGGVVNGKAVNLVKPPYPPAAKAVRASGAVNVQVTIDENGNVISASAISGHALLRGAAESAARSSKFSPTMLSGQKVKVTGVIIYNFTAQ